MYTVNRSGATSHPTIHTAVDATFLSEMLKHLLPVYI